MVLINHWDKHILWDYIGKEEERKYSKNLFLTETGFYKGKDSAKKETHR